MAPKPREIPPGSVFNNYTVIREVHVRSTHRHRYFLCRCSCGVEREVRMDHLGVTTNCIECSKKYDHLYKQVPGCSRDIQDSHAWECWNNMRLRSKDRGIPVCSEWEEFEPFLKFYLASTGLSLTDVLRPRFEWSYFHAERINKEIGWCPDNTVFVRFVTERARHIPTYQYWWKLKHQGLLCDDLLSYKTFVNTFGTKVADYLLVRSDIDKPHSIENSYWRKRNVRRKHWGS